MIGLFYNLDTNLELVTFISVPALTAQKIYTNCHQPQVQAQIHHEMEGASWIYAIVEQNSGQCYIGYADTNLAWEFEREFRYSYLNLSVSLW